MMNNIIKKCSCVEHEEINATSYCFECKVNMCKKCENFHSKLCKLHHCYNFDKNLSELFIGFCKEVNHMEKLEYYCKNHNIICCGLCITKIKGKNKGQHKDCDVCFIEDIKDDKKNKLKSNFKQLEGLSKTLEETINSLKRIIEKINENKEELKIQIQKIFTKIRNELNEREDKLLLEVDKKFEEKFFNENIIKESEKMPNKIKACLEKKEIIEDDWKDENRLSLLINHCINIENNIKDINIINENIKKYNSFDDFKMRFLPEKDDEIKKIIDIIKTFGNIDEIGNFSKIISFSEKQLIFNWIGNNVNDINLLYRMTEDGNSFITFHDKCDNQYPALFIAKTKEGHKFGGYTSIGWNSNSSTYLTDEKSFLFSLNKKSKYEVKEEKKVIGCYSSRGVDFHNDCYFYQDNMTKCYSSGDYSFLKGVGRVLADNKNDTTFIVEEVEVFKVISY